MPDKMIKSDDVPDVITALRNVARDQRNYLTTLGKGDPPEGRTRAFVFADNCDRIATELEA